MIYVDPEFRDHLPAQSIEQFQELKDSVRKNGQLDPIVVWNGTVVDGHHRLRACQELGIEPKVQHREFASRSEALRWMFDLQVSRRNLSDDQQCALAVLRGYDPPKRLAYRASVARELPREHLQKVLDQPRYTIRFAHNQWKRETGHAPQVKRRRKPATAPAPAPAPAPADPVEVRRTALGESQAKRERNALADRVQVLEAQLDSIARPNSQALPAIAMHHAPAGKRPGTAVTLLSDVHAGERVFRTSAVDNYYSPGVCRIRLERYFAGVAWLINNNRSWADIQDLVLWFGGDMVTGHIHDELAETSQSAIETITWLEPLLVAGVQTLQREADVNVRLVCSYGNHGRDTQKIRRATGAEHSYEWGMYQRLARQLPGVRVLADKGGHQYVDVYGRTLHFHHGDEIRYGGGVGGIMIPGNKAVAAWDRVRASDVHHFGHYHQYLDAGRVVFNGSLKGYDSFAMSIKAAPEIAQQAFYIYDAKRGRTACSPVWVVDSEAEAELERKGE